jgi:carbonic anhydrase/acetyltransferase-like protein (isoleucine patch superfamily)
MSGISGAAANQAKKQMKKAIHVKWKARICGVAKLKRLMRVAFDAILFTDNGANISSYLRHHFMHELVILEQRTTGRTVIFPVVSD